jgi:hypothetical protein
MLKLKHVTIEGENFFFSFSFDIDDFIGDGVRWLQIYNSKQNLIYDKPFASSMNKLNTQRIAKIIKEEFLTY